MDLLDWAGRIAVVAQGSGQNVGVAVGFGGGEAEDVGDPGIEIDVFKGRHGFAGEDVRAGGEEAGFHFGHGGGVKAVGAGFGGARVEVRGISLNLSRLVAKGFPGPKASRLNSGLRSSQGCVRAVA